MTALAPTLQAFFTDRLIRQRQASPHTLAAYRDTLRLLLVFASARQKREPSKLGIDHLEHQRENGVRTRNARLAAIRSLFRYAALRHPEHAAVIERVLAIPPKRFDRRLVTFLTEAALKALVAAPDVVGVMRVWLAERVGETAEPVFSTQTGRVLSRDAVEHRLAKYVEIAA